jgi:hypothetical protein
MLEIDRVALVGGFALLLIAFGFGLPDSDEELLGEVIPKPAVLPGP